VFVAVTLLVAHINLFIVLALAVLAFLVTELLCAAVDRRRPFAAGPKQRPSD
jgi:hypothetical protein